MRFDFKGRAYTRKIEYKKRAIDAILDTGATNTTIDIKSLSKLMEVSAQAIFDIANNHIVRWPQNSAVITASGNTNRTIEIKLNDIILAGHKFPELYLKLNVDNDSWKKNLSDDKSVKSHVLIGLDIIRNGRIQGNKDYIEILDFDYETYIKEMEQKYKADNHNIINLFETLEINKSVSS